MSELAVALAMALALGSPPAKAKPDRPAIERTTPAKPAQAVPPRCAPALKLQQDRCVKQASAPVAGS
jgi:hypothetical protein